MTFRFWYQAIVGLITIFLVIFFGTIGGLSLILMALIPLILRWKGVEKEWDERELQLFYLSNNYTIGFIILFMVLINTFADLTVNGRTLNSHWLLLSIAGIFFGQGLSGIIVFKFK